MNANSFGGLEEAESLRALSVRLMALPPHSRGAMMQTIVGFRTGDSLNESFDVGPIRAAFASYWESTAGAPVPLQALRAALEPPIPIGTVLQFSLLTFAVSCEELEGAIVQLVAHLGSILQANRPNGQLPLFPLDREIQGTMESGRLRIGTTVSSLEELVAAGMRYPTIYADPPWAYDNEASRAAAAGHYPTMPLDAICREPVSELAEDNAHLHLWTTNAFLREAFEVMKTWGFEFKSCLVWVKDELGMGNYWRVSHEFLLLGVRGSLTFRDRSIPSWIRAKRTVHSRKPGSVRALIERVSPGPYLELFGREELIDSAWTVHGNQVERRLF